MKKAKKLLIKLLRVLLGPIRIFNRVQYQKIYKKWMRLAGINLMGGNPGYISPNVNFDQENYSLIYIEEDVVISQNVTLLVHDYSVDHLTYRDASDVIMRPIHLKKHSFIGSNALLLPGTVVGINSIIGAGSVVKGTVPDNVVVCGNPAKVICSISEYIGKHSDFNDMKK